MLCCCTTVSLKAQITGQVHDQHGEPMAFVNMLLLKPQDSSFVQGALTDMQGRFALEGADKGSYLLRLTFIGFKQHYAPVFQWSGKDRLQLATLVMQEDTQELEGVEVTAQRMKVEQIPEGKVLNIQGSVMTKGSTALQVLERSPGVMLDRRNNVLTLNGQQGTLIMINGRAQRMSQADLINMLNSMNADNIESIELLTNPSAKYDADGGAGIINLKLAKRTGTGTSGSLSAGFGYGWADKESLSATLNTQLRGVQVFASYAFNHDKTFYNWHGVGHSQNPFFGYGTFDFNSENINNQRSHNVNIGLEKEFTSDWTLGGNLMFNPGKQVMRTDNFGIYTYTSIDDFDADIQIDQEIKITNLNASFYADKEVEGGSWSFGADYLAYDNQRPSRIVSAFMDEQGNPVDFDNAQYAKDNRGESLTDIRIAVAQADFNKSITSELSLEAGLKNSYSFTRNQALVQQLEEGEWVTDVANVSSQDIEENITAGYVSLAYAIDSLTSLNAGLRYENWQRDYGDASLDGSFGRLFPSVFLSRKLKQNSSLQFAWNRRVTRPSYNDLASFVVYNSPISVFTGNPLLRSTITDNLRLGWQIGGVNLDLAYTHEDKPIVAFQQVEREGGTSVAITPQNLDYQKSFMLQTNIPIDIAKWWTFSLGINTGLREFKVLHTREQVVKQYMAFDFNANSTINLPGGVSLELSGFFNGDHYYGTMDAKGFGMLDMGFKKELGKNGGTIQLAITDVLKTMRYSNITGGLTREAFDSYAEVNFYPESKNSRIFRLTYSRSFGNGKGHKERQSKSAEEKARINQN
ncbi:MAG: outer membrane beta-barrel family protein [Roseivirga sp.]